jgi:hypothetical protein
MDAETLGSLAALIAAITGLLTVVQNTIAFYQVRRESKKNRDISVSNNAAIAAVDVKVDAVAEQTNGHMTSLIAAVAPVDPTLATKAALKIVETADRAAEKLKAAAIEKAAERPTPKRDTP